MAIKITMPALSPTMTEGKIVSWLKKEGDIVKSGDVLAEIETDKALISYEASDEGVLGKILIPDDTADVKVRQVIAILLEEGEDESTLKGVIADISASTKTQSAIADSVQDEIPIKKEVQVDKISSASAPVTVDLGNQKQQFITPLAKRMANDGGLDIGQISGSGPNGRIIKRDVEQALSSKSAISSLSLSDALHEDRPVSSFRKVIATRLLESKQTIPHYYLTVACNLDSLLASRSKMNMNSHGAYRLSINDFIIKAVALALRDNPDVNVSWLRDHIRYYKDSDIAVAVATDRGLFTPIIKKADSRSIVEISNDVRSLAKKAKEGRLTPAEYQGGSFTISNLGMFGIKEFVAIINPPHSSILAVGATEQKPIVVDGQIVIANMMNVTLSADHRTVDGALGAVFLNSFKQYIEEPILMLV